MCLSVQAACMYVQACVPGAVYMYAELLCRSVSASVHVHRVCVCEAACSGCIHVQGLRAGSVCIHSHLGQCADEPWRLCFEGVSLQPQQEWPLPVPHWLCKAPRPRHWQGHPCCTDSLWLPWAQMLPRAASCSLLQNNTTISSSSNSSLRAAASLALAPAWVSPAGLLKWPPAFSWPTPFSPPIIVMDGYR
jgi:hypothetical protein